MDISSIFKKYYRPLCLYAMHYLQGDVEEAEDVVQDCFERMMTAECQHPQAYLYSAVRNECLNVLRRKHVLVDELYPYDLEGPISDEEAQDRSWNEARLWEVIERLPTRCRQIFIMSKRDGMKYKEIAEELQLSEKTVEHQISKALRILRNCREDLLMMVLTMF